MKKIFLGLICCLVVIGLATGCDNHAIIKDDSKFNNITINAPEGLDVKTYISSGERQLIVSVTNKSGKIIGSGYIDVSYYDENNKKITILGSNNQRFNMLENNNEIVFCFDLPGENTSKFYIPAKSEVEITIDEEYEEKFTKQISEYEDKFLYSHTDDGIITVNITNNSSKVEFIPRSISIVFYKNNKPVFSRDIILTGILEPRQTKTTTIDIPNDFKKTNETGEVAFIDYDSIKIFRIVDGNS